MPRNPVKSEGFQPRTGVLLGVYPKRAGQAVCLSLWRVRVSGREFGYGSLLNAAESV